VPRPRSLTGEQIAAAALAVLERDGLGALSMRTVAAELGAGTMSLYRYVRGRDELEDLVLARVLDGVPTDTPAGANWDDRLTVLAVGVWRVVGDHPEVVPLLLTRRARTPASMHWGEAVMSALDDAGLAGAERALAFRTLLSYVIGAIQVEHYGPLSGEGTAALAALPASTFPLLADTAAHARAIAPEDEFRRGLEAVIRGLRPPPG
jgi:AcrR family transcriptional regulator